MDVLDLTGELVAIDSHNPGGDERRIAGYVQGWAAERGIDCTVLEPVPGRPNAMLTIDRGPGRHLALCGHLDTKPVGDAREQWRTDPWTFTIDGDLGYGLGASDMKGAVAAMLCVAADFAMHGSIGTLSVLLTADEEQGSQAGARALVAAGALPPFDAMVIGEPSGMDRPWEAMYLVSRGICVFDVIVRTRQGHSGLSERLGRNAVQVAADIVRALEEFRPAYSGEYAPTVNPGMLISGGVSSGTWPGMCTVCCELRLVPGMERDEVRSALEAHVRAAAGDAEVQIRYRDGSLGWKSASALDPQAPVVRAAQRAAARVLGAALPIAAYPGGTDASFFIPAGIPAVTSLGPGWLTVSHGPNECVGITQLHEAVALYRALTGEFLTA